MIESFKMTVMLMIAVSVIFIAASVTETTSNNPPDTTIKKYIDEEANMMCYYTDTWRSCFYVLED